MKIPLIYFAGLFFLSGAVSAYLAYRVWKKRAVSGGSAFVSMMLGVAEWCVCAGMQLITDDPASIIFWSKAAYPGIFTTVIGLFYYALYYSSLPARWTHRKKYLLIIPAAVFTLLAFTNQWHGWVWPQITPNPVAGETPIIFHHGPAYWALVIFIYSLLTVATILLVQAIFRFQNIYRYHAVIIIIGIIFPWLSNVIFILDLSPLRGVDLAPMAFMLTGLCLALGIFLFHLGDIVPVAHEQIFEMMKEAIIVVDLQGRFIDLNPAANRLLLAVLRESETEKNGFIGKPVLNVLKNHPEWAKNLLSISSTYSEILLELEKPSPLTDLALRETRIYDLHVLPLLDTHRRFSGNLVIMRDITERKRIEQAELEQRTLAEALRDITSALTSTLNLEEVLDRILENLGKVVPIDIVNILLVDEKGNMQVVRSAGYEKLEQKVIRIPPELHVNDYYYFRLMNATGEPCVVPDTSQSPNWQEVVGHWLKSYLGVPIRVKGINLGFLNLNSTTPNFYNEGHVKKLLVFADQAGIAIENAQVYARMQKFAAEAEALRKASAAINSSLDFKKVISLMLEQINEVIPSDTASVLLVDGNEVELVAAHNMNNPDLYIGTRWALMDAGREVVLKTGQLAVFPDVQEVYTAFKAPLYDYIHGLMIIPLFVAGEIIGFMNLDSRQVNRFTDEDQRVASAFAGQVAIALQNARLFSQVQQLAVTDSLTGLMNRRFFFTQLENEFERARRYQKPLSLLMVDIDHFKTVNDTYGHMVGDQVLQQLSQIFLHTCRKIDLVARYGGEEFVILMPETRVDEAGIAAERLRQLIAGMEIFDGDTVIHITTSMGLSTLNERTESAAMLVDCSDRAMYLAKQNGRNRVETLPCG